MCSIDFDQDDELFATAGVSRRIKVFDFATVLSGLLIASLVVCNLWKCLVILFLFGFLTACCIATRAASEI